MPVPVPINLTDTTPAPPAGSQNVRWQADDGNPRNVSAYVQRPTAGITIDGAGAEPSTGSKGYLRIPFAGTIKKWTLLADQQGSVAIDVRKSSFAGFPTTSSIVASLPPKLTNQQKAESTNLTGWTTGISAGDVLEFVLTSVTSCTRLHLQLEIERN